ncbi:phage protein, HK97 gp10 family [Terrisporobacter glycolicus]|nr:phage protein, HK97 gp10 family [Terrisporobacter glycolicus]
MDIKVTVDIDDLNIDNITDEIDDVINTQLESAGYQIERDAKANTPVDTGRLRESITTTSGDMEVEVGTNVEYAHFIEFGTRYQNAQPFLEPAAESNLNGLEDEISDAIKRLF